MQLSRSKAHILLALTLFFVLPAYAEQLKLGMIIPLTGSAPTIGETLRGVIRLAQLKNIEVHFEDDRCEAKSALSAYFKLRGQGVKIFYMACSGSILATAPHAKRNGDLILTTYAGSSRIRETGTEVLRFNPDAISIADGVAAVVTPDLLPAVILHEEQEYADSLARHLSSLPNVTIKERVSYRSDATSFAAEILKIKQLKPKSIILVPVSHSAAQIALRQFSQQAVNLPVIGEVNLCDYPFKPSDFGLHGRCIIAKFRGAAYEEFLAKYAALIGQPPAYPFYDAMALDVFEKLDREAVTTNDISLIKSQLLSGFSGKFLRYRLSPSGEALGVGEYLSTETY